MEVVIKLSGDRELIYWLTQAQVRAIPTLRAGVSRATAMLQSAVKATAPHRTGALADSVHRSVSVSNGRVLGRVRVTSPYGAATEYGYQKEERVRAHLRSTANGTSTVREYLRKANIPKQPFLFNTKAELEEAIQAIIRGTLDEMLPDQSSGPGAVSA